MLDKYDTHPYAVWNHIVDSVLLWHVLVMGKLQSTVLFFIDCLIDNGFFNLISGRSLRVSQRLALER